MHIVQVYNLYSPNIGGIETLTRHLGRELAGRGHRITVVTSTTFQFKRHQLPARERMDGMDILRFDVLPFPGRYSFVAPGALGVLRSLAPDVVHVFSYLPSFLTNASVIKGRLLKLPVVMSPIYHPSRRDLYGSAFKRALGSVFDNYVGGLVLRRASALTALTEEEAAFYHSKGGHKVTVIPEAVEDAVAPPPDLLSQVARRFGVVQNRTVLCVGRVHWYKGVDLLVEAWPRVEQAVPEARLIVAGDDAGFLSQARESATKSGCRNILFTGRVGDAELSALYDLCGAIVSPSRFETFVRIALEAWTHRKPIICFDLGAATDHIPAEAGAKVAPFSVEELGQTLISLLLDESRARSMGEAGYKLFKARHTWQKIADQYEEVYRSVVRPPG